MTFAISHGTHILQKSVQHALRKRSAQASTALLNLNFQCKHCKFDSILKYNIRTRILQRSTHHTWTKGVLRPPVFYCQPLKKRENRDVGTLDAAEFFYKLHLKNIVLFKLLDFEKIKSSQKKTPVSHLSTPSKQQILQYLCNTSW